MSDRLCFVVDLKVNAPYDLLSRVFVFSPQVGCLISERGKASKNFIKKFIILLFSYGVVCFLINFLTLDFSVQCFATHKTK